MSAHPSPEAWLAKVAVELPAEALPGPRTARGSAVMVRVADVAPTAVRWLWPSRIALGKLTVLAGHPGLGKSQLTAFLAARITKGGAWPAGEGRAPLGSVVMLSAEDDLADTIRPRLDAAGADVSRVHVLDSMRGEGEDRRTFDLSRDVKALRDELVKLGDVRLVVIDPVTAYLGGTDSHRNADVRGLLAPLSALAAERGVAILLVSHLTKGGGEAMGRVTGSMGFVAAARAAFVVSKDAEDPERRLLLPLKNNLGNDRTGLAYRIEERAIGGGLRAPTLAWEDEPVAITADEALAPRDGEGEDAGGALEEAKAVLLDALADGPVRAPAAFKAAREAAVSDRTLKRAKAALGVEARKCGFGIGWMWHPPAPKGANEDEGGQA